MVNVRVYARARLCVCVCVCVCVLFPPLAISSSEARLQKSWRKQVRATPCRHMYQSSLSVSMQCMCCVVTIPSWCSCVVFRCAVCHVDGHDHVIPFCPLPPPPPPPPTRSFHWVYVLRKAATMAATPSAVAAAPTVSAQPTHPAAPRTLGETGDGPVPTSPTSGVCVNTPPPIQVHVDYEAGTARLEALHGGAAGAVVETVLMLTDKPPAEVHVSPERGSPSAAASAAASAEASAAASATASAAASAASATAFEQTRVVTRE